MTSDLPVVSEGVQDLTAHGWGPPDAMMAGFAQANAVSAPVVAPTRRLRSKTSFGGSVLPAVSASSEAIDSVQSRPLGQPLCDITNAGGVATSSLLLRTRQGVMQISDVVMEVPSDTLKRPFPGGEETLVLRGRTSGGESTTPGSTRDSGTPDSALSFPRTNSFGSSSRVGVVETFRRCLDSVHPDSVPVVFEEEDFFSARNVSVDSDAEDDDPQRCSEYLLDIYGKLDRDEASSAPLDWLEAQPELTEHDRAVTVDWLVEVHLKYNLRTESLFLSVSLLDRFLQTRKVHRRDLQLISVSAAFIASKFEEIDPPDIRDFVFVTEKAVTKEAILDMEVRMLRALEFCLCRPTAVHFVDRYQRANHCSEKQRFLQQYLLELSLVDFQMGKYSPAHQAAAALLVSGSLLQQQVVLPAAAARTVRTCAEDMCSVLEAAEIDLLQSVYRKFSRAEFGCVAVLDF